MRSYELDEERKMIRKKGLVEEKENSEEKPEVSLDKKDEKEEKNSPYNRENQEIDKKIDVENNE